MNEPRSGMFRWLGNHWPPKSLAGYLGWILGVSLTLFPTLWILDAVTKPLFPPSNQDDPYVVQDCTAAAQIYASNSITPEKLSYYKESVDSAMARSMLMGPSWEMTDANMATCWRAHFDYFRGRGMDIPVQAEEQG